MWWVTTGMSSNKSKLSILLAVAAFYEYNIVFCLRAESRYFRRCLTALVAYGNTSYLNTCLQAWLALRLQLIGASLQAALLAAVTVPLFLWPERLDHVGQEPHSSHFFWFFVPSFMNR